jgi:hypothetical protein
MDDIDLTIPDCLNRKLHPEYNTPLPKNVSWKLKDPSKIVWPSEKQIAKAIRRRERERREDAASKIELGSMRIRRGQ